MDDEKDRFCSSRSKLLFRVESRGLKRKERDGNEKENDEKYIKPSKLDVIPLDLELAILTRLPAKSLMKFRCVSNMWYSIIRSQRFVDSYYAMSLATQSSRFMIAVSNGPFARSEDHKLLFIFSSSYDYEKEEALATNLDMTIPSWSLCPGSNCTSVHGLIGCTNTGPFIICNPSTRKVTTLPMGAFTCLGYDPVNSQFKALTRISSPYSNLDSVVHEVVTLGGGKSSRNKVTTPFYHTVTKAICINGFVYQGAWTPTRSENPVIVCFDVRYEKISFIKAPLNVVGWEGESILIEYKGKLASIERHPYAPFRSFDLWILEDVKNHDWSKQTFELQLSLGMGKEMTSPGTNKAGEIIFAPKCLPRYVEPFYIFFYNLERKDIRRVRLQGIADDEDFRRRYQISEQSCVFISPQHVESIASL